MYNFDHNIFFDIVLVQPEFVSVQENQTFTEGTDAAVLCPANFGANPRGNMIWSRNNLIAIVGDRFIPEDGQLRIQNIRIDDSGDYQCSLIRLGIVD